MRRAIIRAINRSLSRFGVGIQRVGPDFDSRYTMDSLNMLMCKRLELEYSQWFACQSVFPILKIDIDGAAYKFFQMYMDSPFRSRQGGSRFNNLLSLYLISYAVRPRLIIDSGTFQGASAWALANGSPDSTVMSFDIDMSRLVARHPAVSYVESDWAAYDFDSMDMRDSLCYFDDHLDQAKRLIESEARKIRYAIFDDDLSLTAFPNMAHGGLAAPKIEFLFDEALADLESIAWIGGGKEYNWKVDHDYMATARETIEKTDRLPNTSGITGIYQLPYRVVSFRSTAPMLISTEK